MTEPIQRLDQHMRPYDGLNLVFFHKLNELTDRLNALTSQLESPASEQRVASIRDADGDIYTLLPSQGTALKQQIGWFDAGYSQAIRSAAKIIAAEDDPHLNYLRDRILVLLKDVGDTHESNL